MANTRRGIGLTCVVVGAVVLVLGAFNWIYIFVLTGGAHCSGTVCYQTIVEPAPWYVVGLLPGGLVVLLLGVFLFARTRAAEPRP